MPIPHIFSFVVAPFIRRATEDEVVAFKNSKADFCKQLWEKFPHFNGCGYTAMYERIQPLKGRPTLNQWIEIGWNPTPMKIPYPANGYYIFRTASGEKVQVQLKHTTAEAVKNRYQSSYMGGGFLS